MIVLVGGWSRLLPLFFFLRLQELQCWGVGTVVEWKGHCGDRVAVCVFGYCSSLWFWIPLSFHSCPVLCSSALSFPIVQYFYRYWECNWYAGHISPQVLGKVFPPPSVLCPPLQTPPFPARAPGSLRTEPSLPLLHFFLVVALKCTYALQNPLI